MENLERERDFYYSKLREVEIMCQQHEDSESPFLQQVCACICIQVAGRLV